MKHPNSTFRSPYDRRRGALSRLPTKAQLDAQLAQALNAEKSSHATKIKMGRRIDEPLQAALDRITEEHKSRVRRVAIERDIIEIKIANRVGAR